MALDIEHMPATAEEFFAKSRHYDKRDHRRVRHSIKGWTQLPDMPHVYFGFVLRHEGDQVPPFYKSPWTDGAKPKQPFWG